MDMSWQLPVRRPAVSPAGTPAGALNEPGRYAAPRLHPIAAGAAATITGGLIAAIAWFGPASLPAHVVERRLIVVNLAAPPAAPPAPAKPVPPRATPTKPVVVAAPTPLVTVPAPSSPAPVSVPAAPAPATPTEAPVQRAPTTSLATVPPRPPAPAVAPDLSTTMISASPPDYPVMSRRNREQGTVFLRVTLTIDGKIDTIAIERSSGVERLDKAALAAVKHWRWSPTIRDGRPVTVSGIVRLPFVLRT